MGMTVIVINGPINGALINVVHLWTLKYVDNAPSFLKETHKVLLGMRHGTIIAIFNNNVNYIGVKLSLVRMANGIGRTINATNVR